jgi:ankyrin repeat domain-containing protein 50
MVPKTLPHRSIVIEHLEALCLESDLKICVCYVFFRYSGRADVTVRSILETLVKQTLERHPDCLSLVERTYSRHLHENTEPTELQLLSLLGELTDGMQATFYILDALDEAPTKMQLAVVRVLASLKVKLFITSRPLKTVEAHFHQAHTFTIVAQDADIALHIAKAIDDNAELQRLLKANPFLRDEIVSTINRKCGGM